MSFSTFGAPQDPPTRPLATPPADPEPGSRRRTLVLVSALAAVAVAAGGYAVVSLGSPEQDATVDLVLPAAQPATASPSSAPATPAPVATRNLFAALVSDEELTAPVTDPAEDSSAVGGSGGSGVGAVGGVGQTPAVTRTPAPTATRSPSPTPTAPQLVDVATVCSSATEGAASVFRVLTDGTGTPKHLGHSLGTTVVGLRELGARSEDEPIGLLVIGVGDAANGVREQLIAGTPPAAVDTTALKGAADALGDPCDVALDPLAG